MTALSLPRPLRLSIRHREAAVAAGAFVVFCAAVLLRPTSLLEPDDLAYRASILALAHGHLTLSQAQYDKLTSVAQWVRLPDGRYVSEKNPGYPFFAVPFYWLHALRLAPLFYGALGCAGLYAGARRWLGRGGGAWAVVLFLCSGAALVFAWRPTMPTFTDASLVAGGTGALLWAHLADDAAARRRALAGLAGFAALEAATSMRYTDGLALGLAVVAALVYRRPGWKSWLASVAVFGAAVAAFDQLVYGGATETGYASGEITFSLGALGANLHEMPRHLLYAIPTLVPALAATAWIAVRRRRRDVAVAAWLTAAWLSFFVLYLAYDWTVGQAAHGGVTVHVVRFYLPALGALALVGAWLATRLPSWWPYALLAALAAFTVVAYPHLAAAGAVGVLPTGGATFGP